MYATDALQQALYDTLYGSIDGGVYDHVPPGAGYPYTVLGDTTEIPDDTHDGDGSEVTATLHTWSAAQGMEEVNQIGEAIDDLLHHDLLTIAGARNWSAEREFSETLRDRDPDTGRILRHRVVRYRFRLEET